ncbi:MAG: DUF4397 domain-containing protein [Acidobacteriaceae bacterium]
MYSNWRGFSGILALSACLLAMGCGNSTASYVRSVNASNGLTNYTIQVGLQGVASSLPYGTEGVQPKGDNYSVNDTSGNYRPIADGTNQKVIVTNSANTALVSGTQSFLANTYYTIITLAPAPLIELRTLTDGDVAPSSGNFKLRMMQASPTAGAVDVYVVPQGASIGGATPIVTNLQFGNAASTYSQASAAAVQVEVTPTGNPAKVLYTGVFTGVAGNLYTAYFLDPPANNPSKGYSLLLVQDPVLTAATSGM